MKRLALAATLAGAVLAPGPAGAARPASLPEAGALITKARHDLENGDGIAAQIHLEQALGKGAATEAVAAYMGEALIDQNALDRARDWLAPGRFTRRTAPLGFRTLARVAQMQGDLPAAAAAFDHAIALTPRDATMWVEIGRMRYAGGEHMLALDAANFALQLDPGNVRVLEFRGQIVRDQYGLVAALPWFEAALRIDPKDVLVLGEYAATLGDLGRAREMLAATRKMLEADPGNAKAYYLQAVLAARAGQTALARGLLDRIGDGLGKLPGAMLLDGMLQLETGNYVLAMDQFEKLLRLQPANTKVRLLLVRALFQSGGYRELVIRFAGDAADRDASPYLLTVMARSYEAIGRRDLAAPLLDRAALARGTPIVRVPEGTPVGDLLTSGDLAQAETLAEQARAADPGSFDTQAEAGDVQLALGRGAAAIERYRLAARIRLPESLMLRMAAAYRSAGQGGEADALAEAFLAEHPMNDVVARLAAGRAADSGDWVRARRLLENLRVNGGGGDPGLLADLAMAQLRSGDGRAAEATASTAYRLQRSSPRAAQAWGLGLAALGRDRPAAQSLLDKARQLTGDSPLIAEGFQRLATGRND